MADHIKLALFSMLAGRDQPRGRALDLYAGTGALAIEAISRGAERADLVEQHAGMCATIRDNLAHTRLSGAATVHRQAVGAFLARPPQEPYDLVLMDPPYADPEIESVVRAVGERGFLAPDGLLVLGHTSRREFDAQLGPLHRVKLRCHGDSCVSFYAPAAEDSPSE
jgi:16S rRNA (guanine966-N2)-methyltransferase